MTLSRPQHLRVHTLKPLYRTNRNNNNKSTQPKDHMKIFSLRGQQRKRHTIYPVADPSAVYVDRTAPVRGLTVCNQRIVMTHLF